MLMSTERREEEGKPATTPLFTYQWKWLNFSPNSHIRIEISIMNITMTGKKSGELKKG